MRDKAYLLRLREETNDVLDKLTARGTIRPSKFAIQSNVHCWLTRSFVDCDGDEGLEVLITNASPDNIAFHQFVAEELRKRGVGDVWIQTDW